MPEMTAVATAIHFLDIPGSRPARPQPLLGAGVAEI